MKSRMLQMKSLMLPMSSLMNGGLQIPENRGMHGRTVTHGQTVMDGHNVTDVGELHRKFEVKTSAQKITRNDIK